MGKVGKTEFIWLMALLMSLMALAIDAMLPALGLIAADLEATHPNDGQLVISSIFFGMASGLIIYGPLADSWGRKKVLSLGIAVFMAGNIISLMAPDLATMLFGRWIQGFGAAACRIITLAIIRDQYAGPQMARIMSLIMIVFIIIPAVAPALGQGIIWMAGWRSIFFLFLSLGFTALMWFNLRLPETLKPENRRPFTHVVLLDGIRQTLSRAETRGSTLAAGLIFGAFIGYLNSAQQILQIQYQLGDRFALWFGILALAVGVSSYTNSKLVMHFGLERLVLAALSGMFAASSVALLVAIFSDGHPEFWFFITYIVVTFFCFGLLYGNINAIALRPLGHIAGIATSVTGTFQTLISVLIGGTIGYLYDDTVIPLIGGFCLFSALSLSVCYRLLSGKIRPPGPLQESREVGHGRQSS